jgi:hypothetical protein
MRRAFHIAVILLLGYLIADRTLMHAQASEPGMISCSAGADMVRQDALLRGFPDVAASSQGDAFRSSCYITGRRQVGNLVAGD